MKPEAAYRTLVMKELKKNRQHPVAIENGDTAPGTPDVNCILGWIELKALRGYPKRETTAVRIDHFTQQQRNFLRRRWNLGGGAWLLVQIGTHREIENLLFTGPAADEFVGFVNREDLQELAVMHTFGRIQGRDLVAAMERTTPHD